MERRFELFPILWPKTFASHLLLGRFQLNPTSNWYFNHTCAPDRLRVSQTFAIILTSWTNQPRPVPSVLYSGGSDIIWNGESRGSKRLTAVIKTLKIPVSISGHNHEGYGVTYDANTTYINAANCVGTYNAVQCSDYIYSRNWTRIIAGGAKSVARRHAMILDYYPELKRFYTGKPEDKAI